MKRCQILKSVVLASASPRRKELLKQCGVRLNIDPSHTDETTQLIRPSAIVKELAQRKARSVAQGYQRGIVIGADTIVVYRNEIIGKPLDRRDAFRILSKLNGTCHRVYTGIAIIDTVKKIMKVDYDVSTVYLRRLSAQELTGFAGKHMDKAGAYAVQEAEDRFVERIEGDYYNVVGLPLVKLNKMLKGMGYCLPQVPKALPVL